MTIKTYAPFGYEGAICTVEADIRQGIPAVDIVGFADAGVKELRERMQAAIRNSGFFFPEKRVLLSLSPADLRKEGATFDLPIALAVILASHKDELSLPEGDILVMGEMELSGKLRPCSNVFAALQTAVWQEIKTAIVPKGCEKYPDGIKVIEVESFAQAYEVVSKMDSLNDTYVKNGFITENDKKVAFAPVPENDNIATCGADPGLVNTIACAVAGRHHMLVVGAPGCGKSNALSRAWQLQPLLTEDELPTVNRIHSIAGLTKPGKKVIQRPFRIPHQTASIEGICGGGVRCRPGEISLAHRGILFLDEAAEFRSSVLQMLRVPLESKSITISRAGRSTVFPADFQLLMATNPCPCGNYGSHDKICLCSMKSIEQYWRKFSAPLLDRIAIRYDCNEPIGAVKKTITELRNMIKIAVEIQLKRQGKFNQELSSEELDTYAPLTQEAVNVLTDATIKYNFSIREVADIRRVARTLKDMSNTDSSTALEEDRHISVHYVNEAIRLHRKTIPVEP